jgi:FKBP-type peptidyl-prolyl cis-trans isomerase SlyD
METVKQDAAVTIRFNLKTEIAPGKFKEQPETTTRFIFGVEEQVPTLESALAGAGVGHRFSLHIPPSEIYGDHDPDLIREIPRQGLVKQRLREGQYYRQMKIGSLVSFKILEVRENTVLVDFNEPMAGISAFVDGEVAAIGQASEAEIVEARESHRRKKIGCG